MDYVTEDNGDRKQKIAIVAVAGVLVVAIVVMVVVIIRRRGGGEVPPPPVNVPVNQPINGPVTGGEPADFPPLPPDALDRGSVDPSTLPPVEPGLNRPMTAEEKVRYGFQPNENVWIITSSPTDGSRPSVAFTEKETYDGPPDTDGDGIDDAEEAALGTDPNAPNDYPEDPNHSQTE